MSSDPEIQSLVTANLATVCVESVLTGIFWVLYAGSTYLLVQRHRMQAAQAAGASTRSLFKSPMFIASNIIFATVTAHWGLTIYRLFYAFDTIQTGTESLFFFFANMREPSEIAKTACFLITVLTSDSMIIYRLYIIWNYNVWIIAFPCLTWIGMIVCGVGLCWRLSVYQLGENAYHGAIGHWITSDCTMTFVTNVYCTFCISWRIWRSRIRSQSFGSGGNLMGAMAIIVESALVHTCWNFFFLLEFQLQSVVQFTALDAWSPICGIAFMLINFRVALGWAQKAHSLNSGLAHRVPTASAPSVSTSFPSRKHELSSPGEGVPYSYKEAYLMSPRPYAASQEVPPVYPPLTVNITRVVDKVDDKGTDLQYEDDLV